MRIVILAFVIGIAAGCGDDQRASCGTNCGASVDLSVPSTCPTTVNAGDPCPPQNCAIAGFPCHCAPTGVWTCTVGDMSAHD